MGTGKHRAPESNRPRVGSIVAAGTVPLILALVGTGTANAEPDRSVPVIRFDFGALSDAAAQWPGAEAPNVRPYEGVRIPDDTLSSLQWARPLPAHEYLAPLVGLHAPGPVAPVPPIAPPAGKLRFGDVQVDAPEWLYREQAIQINDSAAMAEADMATFLDSIGMERTRSDRVDRRLSGGIAASRRRDQPEFARFGLEAAPGTAGAGPPTRMNDHVADFSAVTAFPAEQLAVDDDSAADADVAVQVDQVRQADADATFPFGQRTEVGVVADRDPQAEIEFPGHRGAEGDVHPAEVRPVPHHAVLLADHAAERDTDADAHGVRRGRGDHRPRHGHQRGDHIVGVERATGTGALGAIEHRAAQPDPRGGEAVRADVQRDDVYPFRPRPHHQGGPARPSGLAGQFLAHQTRRRQVRGEREDRAAIQSHSLGERGARHRPVTVDVPQQRGEVARADLLGRRCCSHSPGFRHGAGIHRCRSARLRDSASTPAAKSSTNPVTTNFVPAL